MAKKMATKISPKFLAPRPLPHYLGSIPKKKYHFFLRLAVENVQIPLYLDYFEYHCQILLMFGLSNVKMTSSDRK